jgi:hypothetical protein
MDEEEHLEKINLATELVSNGLMSFDEIYSFSNIEDRDLFDGIVNETMFNKLFENRIETVQELIDALNKVQNKQAPIRAFFDPKDYQLSEQAEISMISIIDDSFDGDRVDINLFQFPKNIKKNL